MLTCVEDKLEAAVGLELGKLCVNRLIPFGNSHSFPEVFRDVGLWCDVKAHEMRRLDDAEHVLVIANRCGVPVHHVSQFIRYNGLVNIDLFDINISGGVDAVI
jgi:hypothetical protein